MAEKPGLTETQLQRLVQFINEKWKGNQNCPICNTRKWTLGNHIVTPVILDRGSVSLGGTTYPVAMIVCDNCGHTRFFNVVRTGILDEWDKPKKEEEAKQAEEEKPAESAKEAKNG